MACGGLCHRGGGGEAGGAVVSTGICMPFGAWEGVAWFFLFFFLRLLSSVLLYSICCGRPRLPASAKTAATGEATAFATCDGHLLSSSKLYIYFFNVMDVEI